MRVGDVLVARIAAQAARAVPGVVALRPDLGRLLRAAASSALGQPPDTLPADGVCARVHGGTAEVAVEVVTRLGHNCRDVAQAVQHAVHVEVAAYTGLVAVVRVTIAEVLLDQ